MSIPRSLPNTNKLTLNVLKDSSPQGKSLRMFTRSLEAYVLSIFHIILPTYIQCRRIFVESQNAFNLTMDPKDDYAEIATCTTCRFKEDKSNYWTAVLYF